MVCVFFWASKSWLITSCKTIEQIFLKSEQKCLAGGDRYDNIMSNIKTASKRYRIAKLLVGFYKQVASFVRFFVTKEA